MLGGDHSGILLSVMAERIATEIRSTPRDDSRRLRELYTVAVGQRRVVAAREQLRQANAALKQSVQVCVCVCVCVCVNNE